MPKKVKDCEKQIKRALENYGIALGEKPAKKTKAKAKSKVKAKVKKSTTAVKAKKKPGPKAGSKNKVGGKKKGPKTTTKAKVKQPPKAKAKAKVKRKTKPKCDCPETKVKRKKKVVKKASGRKMRQPKSVVPLKAVMANSNPPPPSSYVAPSIKPFIGKSNIKMTIKKKTKRKVTKTKDCEAQIKKALKNYAISLGEKPPKVRKKRGKNKKTIAKEAKAKTAGRVAKSVASQRGNISYTANPMMGKKKVTKKSSGLSASTLAGLEMYRRKMKKKKGKK
jgi:hypothetical protein